MLLDNKKSKTITLENEKDIPLVYGKKLSLKIILFHVYFNNTKINITMVL